MREIKFRVWDIDGKFFYPAFAVEYDGTVIYMQPDGEQYRPCPKDKCEVQQFTGLKDKNGKDIYEGDIVQGFSAEAGKLLKGFIEYNIKSVNNGCAFVVVGAAAYDIILGHFPKHMQEVIGNIFENKELLNG